MNKDQILEAITYRKDNRLGSWLEISPDHLAAFLANHLSTSNPQEAIDKFMALPEKPKRWEPEMDRLYYYLTKELLIHDHYWKEDDTDIPLWAVGNCFPSLEVARQAREKVKELLTNLS